jgi:hypothetical protein
MPALAIFANRLKLFFTITVLLAFVAQTFHKSFMVFDYYANTAAYAKNCVNKARPKLHCNGKCQMMKKLREEEKKENKNPLRKAAFKDEVLSSKSFYTTHVCFNHSVEIVYGQPVVTMPVARPHAFFHPPGIA